MRSLWFLCLVAASVFGDATVDSILRISRERALCGEYVSSEGILERLTFQNGDAVTVTYAGSESARRYFIKGRTILISHANTFLALELDGRDLVGKEGVIIGKRLRRAGRDAICTPFPDDLAVQKRITRELCVLESQALQRVGRPQEAAALNCP